VDEVLDLHRRQPGFGVQDVVQPPALVAVAQPGLAAARDQQRRHDRGEQRDEVLPEQRRAARAVARRHSMIRSALVSSEAGNVIPRPEGALGLMNSSTLWTTFTGR